LQDCWVCLGAGGLGNIERKSFPLLRSPDLPGPVLRCTRPFFPGPSRPSRQTLGPMEAPLLKNVYRSLSKRLVTQFYRAHAPGARYFPKQVRDLYLIVCRAYEGLFPESVIASKFVECFSGLMRMYLGACACREGPVLRGGVGGEGDLFGASGFEIPRRSTGYFCSLGFFGSCCMQGETAAGFHTPVPLAMSLVFGLGGAGSPWVVPWSRPGAWL
jgi:hypothetical protein